MGDIGDGEEARVSASPVKKWQTRSVELEAPPKAGPRQAEWPKATPTWGILFHHGLALALCCFLIAFRAIATGCRLTLRYYKLAKCFTHFASPHFRAVFVLKRLEGGAANHSPDREQTLVSLHIGRELNKKVS